MAKIGLVLGAGGMVGHAYHAGVLKAVEETTGWDPRTADVIVGTSAGSWVAALLRSGLSVADVAARASGVRPSIEGTGRVDRMGPVVHAPSPSTRARMAAPVGLLRGALRPWDVRIGKLAAAALPEGRVSLAPFAARITWLFDERWPGDATWICAVRLSDGRRVVFGTRDAPRADVGAAVAASCAIPGWFRPVVIGGERYVDGGAHSPTNLDLLAREDLDLVVVSSPMSVAPGTWPPTFDFGARTAIRLRLADEARRVRRRGTPVVAFQPETEDLRAMGWNAMDARRSAPVVEQAYRSALRRFERPEARELADLLAS